VDTIDLEMDETSRVMETLPSVPGDKGMGCNIVDEPLLLDIVIK
jgi:hypothetical protein